MVNAAAVNVNTRCCSFQIDIKRQGSLVHASARAICVESGEGAIRTAHEPMVQVVGILELSRDDAEIVHAIRSGALVQSVSKSGARGVERNNPTVREAQESVRHNIRVGVITHDEPEVVVRIRERATERCARGCRFGCRARRVEFNKVTSKVEVSIFLVLRV